MFEMTPELLLKLKQLARWCRGKPLDMIGNRRMAHIRDIISAAAPQTAQKLLDSAVEKLADSCFDLDTNWKFKPAPSLVTHRPLISDELVEHLRNGSIVSVAGMKRYIDDRHVELDDSSNLDVDAVVFGTGYTADFSLMPEHSPVRPTHPAEQDPQFPFPQLARLYKNIFLPSYPDSITYLCNWTPWGRHHAHQRPCINGHRPDLERGICAPVRTGHEPRH